MIQLYDYTSIKEAEEHMSEMESQGWKAIYQDDEGYIFDADTGDDNFKYSVEYIKDI